MRSIRKRRRRRRRSTSTASVLSAAAATATLLLSALLTPFGGGGVSSLSAPPATAVRIRNGAAAAAGSYGGRLVRPSATPLRRRRFGCGGCGGGRGSSAPPLQAAPASGEAEATASEDENEQGDDAIGVDENRKDREYGGGDEQEEEEEEEGSRGRGTRVRFVNPLLEYGYPPAVEEQLEADRGGGNLPNNNKPLLLYLPGFDGTYLSPFLQFPELSTVFDVRCMVVGVEDRSTFDELASLVAGYVLRESSNDGNSSGNNNSSNGTDVSDDDEEKGRRKKKVNRKKNARQEQEQQMPRPVYLAGESFGGILATKVAADLLGCSGGSGEEGGRDEGRRRRRRRGSRDGGDGDGDGGVGVGTAPPAVANLRGLALINSATCYDRSRLAADGPAVAREMPPWAYPFGLATRLLPLFGDEYSFDQLLLILKAEALPSVIDTAEREAYLGRVAFSLPFVLPVLTRDAMRWRLSEWLEVGCARVASERLLEKLADASDFPPVLVVAAEKDAVLPSIAEAERLAGIFPKALLHIVEGAGHGSTCGSRVDLAALFRRCYPELLSGDAGSAEGGGGRTQMKEEAASGVGEYYGMEPRYDNASVGLNPILYWSRKYYRRYSGRA